MTISINDKCYNREPFKDEYELQGHLEQRPYLLVPDSEAQVASVQREVSLPAAGILDILLIDNLGCPIAVEVKLARNGQSRREVVAQAFDYVSNLSEVTVDELDALVDGALEHALSEINPETNLWKACGTNLRAGIIKVIIAVDEANDDLIRIVRYINDHSDLDVSLVAISKYKNGEILVPNIIVEGRGNRTIRKLNSRNLLKNPFFEEVNDTYNQLVQDELKTRNKAKAYRQIRFNNWPWSVHYEFIDYKSSDQVGVELHLEADEVAHLGTVIKKFNGKEIGGYIIEWHEKWSKKRGRISVKFPVESGANLIANSMKEFIKQTRDEVDKKLTMVSS